MLMAETTPLMLTPHLFPLCEVRADRAIRDEAQLKDAHQSPH